MRGDWLSTGVSWGENRGQGEGDLRNRGEWGQQRDGVRECRREDRPSSTLKDLAWMRVGTHGTSLELRNTQRGGRRGTEEAGKDSSAGEAGAPLTLGEGLGSKVTRMRPRPPGAERKEGEVASGIFRLGSRCL